MRCACNVHVPDTDAHMHACSTLGATQKLSITQHKRSQCVLVGVLISSLKVNIIFISCSIPVTTYNKINYK